MSTLVIIRGIGTKFVCLLVFWQKAEVAFTNSIFFSLVIQFTNLNYHVGR